VEANPLIAGVPGLLACFVKIGLAVLLVSLWRLTLDFYGNYGFVVSAVTLQALALTLLYVWVAANNLILILLY
jgi:hypothetical protein